ncbi:MAG: FadR family transcriptional regulator [Deltaproteobacteria bacterium]|nr:FadR family transcriptional regulator [Deltaproteobacteria bacterium]
MNVKPIQKASATTKVFEALHEMIATGRFRRGVKLPPQEDLARQLGVSRNTLREAVNQLSAMGFLKSRHGVGTVVEPPDPGGYLSTLGGQFLLDTLSVREFIEARICIERNAVRLAVRGAFKEDVRRLRAILEEQRRALEKSDADEFTRQDASFHLAVTQICGNRVLLKFLQTIQDMLNRFIGEVVQLPGAMDDALRFHSRITDAIASKDADLAETQMVLHLFDVVRRIEFNLNTDLKKESLCGFDLVRIPKRKKRVRS